MASRRIGLARPKARSARAPFILIRQPNKPCPKTRRVHAMTAAGWSTVLVAAAALQFAVLPDTDARMPLLDFNAPATMEELPEPDAAEVRLLAATMWAEARSEGEDGMRAVGHVMLNRVGDRFGEDLRTVILSPKQFSAWNHGDPNRPLAMNPDRYATGGTSLETWNAAQRIAREVLMRTSVDPTNGALFYHTRAVRPTWSRHGQGRQVIGQHIFYRDVPDLRERATPARITDIPSGGFTHASATESAVTPSGARAGRVNGVIQSASRDVVDDVNARLAQRAMELEAQTATPAAPLSVGDQAVDAAAPAPAAPTDNTSTPATAF